jgi:hypothetical protein
MSAVKQRVQMCCSPYKNCRSCATTVFRYPTKIRRCIRYWLIYRSKYGTTLILEKRSVLFIVVDPDLDLLDFCRLDPDQRRSIKAHKDRKKWINFMFWSSGCSLLRAEGFTCTLDGLRINNCTFGLNFCKKIFLSALKLTNFGLQDPVSRSALIYGFCNETIADHQHWFLGFSFARILFALGLHCV